MRGSLSWGQIVAEVQQSGEDLQRKQKEQSKQRYLFLRKQNKAQIDEQKQRKSQQIQKKPIERNYAEYLDRLAFEKERLIQQSVKNKQKIYMDENKKLIEQRRKERQQNIINLKSQLQLYKENPLTIKIVQQFEQRKRKSKQINQQYTHINGKIVNQKYQNYNKFKNINNQQDQLQNNNNGSIVNKFNQQKFQRRNFRLRDNNNSYRKVQQIKTQPDSLQRQYESYVREQESFQKYSKDQVYKSAMKIKAEDKIEDANIFRINKHADKQSSSPAYLGRLPLSKDRQKQLQYIDNYIHRQTRMKTQTPLESNQYYPRNFKSLEPLQQHANKIQVKTPSPIYISSQTQTVPMPKKTMIFSPPQRKVYKTYKQFNVLTGVPNIWHEQNLPKTTLLSQLSK